MAPCGLRPSCSASGSLSRSTPPPSPSPLSCPSSPPLRCCVYVLEEVIAICLSSACQSVLPLLLPRSHVHFFPFVLLSYLLVLELSVVSVFKWYFIQFLEPRQFFSSSHELLCRLRIFGSFLLGCLTVQSGYKDVWALKKKIPDSENLASLVGFFFPLS